MTTSFPASLTVSLPEARETLGTRLVQSNRSLQLVKKTSKVPADAILILVSVNVTRLFTNIPKRREFNQYAEQTKQPTLTNPPSQPHCGAMAKATHSSSLKRNYHQVYGSAMGTKKAVPFAKIFMGEVETEI